MKYTDVVTMVNGHTAATVNGRRIVFTPEQWEGVIGTKIVMLIDSKAVVSVQGTEVTVLAEEWAHVLEHWRDTEIRRIAEYKYSHGGGGRDMEKVKADAYIYLAVLVTGLGARAARADVLEGFVMDLLVAGLCTFVAVWSWRSIGK